jgi:hypothetical protein
MHSVSALICSLDEQWEAVAGGVLQNCLRGRPRSLGGITEFSSHQPKRGELNKRRGGAGALLNLLGQPATASEPGEGPLPNPPLGEDDKAGRRLAAFAELGLELQAGFGYGFVNQRPLSGPFGEPLCQYRTAVGEGEEPQNSAGPVLDVGRRPQRVPPEPEGRPSHLALFP